MALKTGRKKTGGSPVKRTAMVNFPDMSAGQRRFYMDIIRTLASELEIQGLAGGSGSETDRRRKYDSVYFPLSKGSDRAR